MIARSICIASVLFAFALAFTVGCINSGPTGVDTATDLPGTTADTTITIGASIANASIRPLLGVNAGPILNGDLGVVDLTTSYQNTGVTAVRTHDLYGPLDMTILYPDRTADPNLSSSYNFVESDKRFAAIQNGEFAVYFRLGDSYNNVTPPENAVERANWVRAAVKVIQHYHEGLWNGFQGNIEHVEIWNEPNIEHFWPAPNTPADFHQLYIETANALRDSFPSLRIGGPGLAGVAVQTEAGMNWTRAFLDAIRDAGAPLDFLSWHLYTNNPMVFETATAFYRKELAARGYAGTELHLTEWNTSTLSLPEPEAVELRAGGRGAALLTAMWITQQDLGIEQSFFYRGADPGLDSPAFFGLLYGDGNPKRTGLAFQLWSTMAAYPTRLAAEITGNTNDSLTVLAATRATADIALLVANIGAQSVDVAVELATGETLDQLDAALSVVSDGSEQLENSAPVGPIFTLGDYSVGLLTLNRK